MLKDEQNITGSNWKKNAGGLSPNNQARIHMHVEMIAALIRIRNCNGCGVTVQEAHVIKSIIALRVVKARSEWLAMITMAHVTAVVLAEIGS